MYAHLTYTAFVEFAFLIGELCAKEGKRKLMAIFFFMKLQLPPHEPAVVRRAVNHFLQVCVLNFANIH